MNNPNITIIIDTTRALKALKELEAALEALTIHVAQDEVVSTRVPNNVTMPESWFASQKSDD